MIELVLVCGFLGAGKTTFLSRALAHRTDPAALIENEVAETDVDSRFLTDIDQRRRILNSVTAIVGGCVCCEKIDELGRALRDVVSINHSRRSDEMTTVFVETTGIADPEPVLALLNQDPVLQVNVRVSEVVVVVDSVAGARGLIHMLLARRQVQAASRVVLSRSDLVDSKHLHHLARIVRRINPAAHLSIATRDTETDLGELEAGSGDDAVFESDGVPEFAPSAMTVRIGIDSWPNYALWLDSMTAMHSDKLLRTKGTLFAPIGPVHVQSVGPTISMPTPADRADAGTVVMIYSGVSSDTLRASLEAFVPTVEFGP
nr:GTP-binding protein [Rhodococcus sp. 06-621-2]